jgi:hypothetical protein
MNLCRLGQFSVVCVLLSACSRSPTEPVARAEPVATTATVESAPGIVTPEVSINAVMVALIDHAAHSLWAVEQNGRAPQTDKDWQVVEEHAVQIAAAGPAVTAGGTGPTDAAWVKSPSWHTYAQGMTNAGIDAMQAARKKDFTALVTANGQLVESCEQCHKAFKPDLPTEGIAHLHSH